MFEKTLNSNSNNNSNNNNNVGVVYTVLRVSRDHGVGTATVHPFVPKVLSVATTAHAFRPMSAEPPVLTAGSQPPADSAPRPCIKAEASEPEREDIILTQPLSSDGSETSQATPTRPAHPKSPPLRRGSIERKRFYNSLADINSKKFAERRKSHKSTENLVSKREEEEPGEEPVSRHRPRLMSADSPVAGDRFKKAAKRKLFSSWRRSSQSTASPSDTDHAHIEGAVVYV